MKRFQLLAIVGTITLGFAAADQAQAEGRFADRLAARHARGMSWHAPYIHTATGAPVVYIVPPTAHMQTSYSWGVAQNTMTPIYHQFRRSHPGEYEIGGEQFNHTPRWPSHTDQFGVYYIRGPY
ncbi:MAG: hypothetical protein CMJ64_24550 [Planctomycetaceae bacterium]|nr:hypothetical protein [Planctomycetaceae bacterium]